MRMMMKVALETEKTNEGIRNGKMMATIQSMMAELKPESAYFTTDEKGRRTGYVIFDMKEPSEMPKIAEPWFMGFNAEVTVTPVMVAADLAKAAPDLEKAARAL